MPRDGLALILCMMVSGINSALVWLKQWSASFYLYKPTKWFVPCIRIVAKEWHDSGTVAMQIGLVALSHLPRGTKCNLISTHQLGTWFGSARDTRALKNHHGKYRLHGTHVATENSSLVWIQHRKLSKANICKWCWWPEQLSSGACNELDLLE